MNDTQEKPGQETVKNPLAIAQIILDGFEKHVLWDALFPFNRVDYGLNFLVDYL